jgi:uncharacterized repeat protein (TIGR02543 family)
MYLSIKTHIFRIRYLIALLLFLMFWIGGGSEARAKGLVIYYDRSAGGGVLHIENKTNLHPESWKVGNKIIIKNDSYGTYTDYWGHQYSISINQLVFLFDNDTGGWPRNANWNETQDGWRYNGAVFVDVNNNKSGTTARYGASSLSGDTPPNRWTYSSSNGLRKMQDSRTGLTVSWYDYKPYAERDGYGAYTGRYGCYILENIPSSLTDVVAYYELDYKGSNESETTNTLVGRLGTINNLQTNLKSLFGTNQNINMYDPDGNERWQDGAAGTFEFQIPGKAGWKRAYNEDGNTSSMPQGSQIQFRNIQPSSHLNFNYISCTGGSGSWNGNIYTYTVGNVAGSVNIYTKWKTSAVTFNGNGGSIVKNASQSFSCRHLQSNEQCGSFQDTGAYRTGYTLLGWADNASATSAQYAINSGVWDDWIAAHSKTTLYAVWQINSYYLDLNGEGSAISDHGGISPAGRADVYINGTKVQSDAQDYYALHPYGTKYEIDFKEVPGYTLNVNSISVTPEGTNGSHKIDGSTVTGTIGAGQSTVIGNYSPNSYTVEYYTNDGTGTNGEGTKIASETWSYAAEKTLQGQGTLQRVYTVSYSTNVESTSHSKPAQPVQQTYTYVPLGWSTNQKAVKADYAFGDKTQNLTTEKNGVVKMYVVWGPQSTEFKLPTPVRQGYTFEGWYDGNTKIGNGGATTYKPTKDTTLTAHWSKPIIYHAYYSLYGGSAALRKDFTVEDTFTLSVPKVNQNYTFLGWTGGTDPQDHGAWGMNKAQEFTNATPITVPVGTYGDIFFRAVYRPTSQYLHDYPSGNTNAYYAESSSQEIKY